MEVPCCAGLVHIAQEALQKANADIPAQEVVISIEGQVLQQSAITPTAATA